MNNVSPIFYRGSSMIKCSPSLNSISRVNFAESTVKEAAVEAAEDGSKTYQVVLTDKEGTESTVFFNEKGEILK